VEQWLIAHQQLAYLVLFVGAYFETIIGPSFFIPGEVFFIPAALLGGVGMLNIWLVVIVCYAGGILGDSSSYLIGKKAGNFFLSILLKKERKIFNFRNYEQGEAFFRNHGPKAIFLARVGGPFSWVMPFLAGIWQVPYQTFLKYNIPGIIVGIGWFLVVGYFFGSQYQMILEFIKTFFWLMLPLLAIIILGWVLIKKVWLAK